MEIKTRKLNLLTRINQKSIKIRLFSGKAIKIIATFSMVLDHFCKIVCRSYLDNVLVPISKNGQISFGSIVSIDQFIRFKLYPIGEVAFPLFCFMISEGFVHTHSRKKYFLSMLMFAFLSELPFDIAFFESFSRFEGTFPFYWQYQNVFFTLALGIATLCIIDRLEHFFAEPHRKHKIIIIEIFCILLMTSFANLIRSDYGGYGILLISCFFIFRKNRIYQIICLLLVFILCTGNQPTISIICASVLILLYNGARGQIHRKYSFYLFYPAHIIIFHTFSKLIPELCKRIEFMHQ